ncbi:hypothetical protein BKA63DRAFT_571733 [Paraphoma chrysanthemicola]|nr:hypothetical protein BKA63DRAFT_571733 [Paraphoma chrysanthemicola]
MKKSFFTPPNLLTRLTILILLGLIPLSMLAAFLIVHIADGDAISSWRISPAVLLALISSLVNICLGTVLSFGVAVRWWCAVSREGGTTLKSLHLIWERGAGVGLWSALKMGKDARRVALAALIVAGVKFGANPLLQNALSTERRDVLEVIPMRIGVASEIPDGRFGNRTRDEQGRLTTTLSALGARVLRRQWMADTIYSYPSDVDNIEKWAQICPRNTTRTCGGFACPVNSTCEMVVPSAGITYNCSTAQEVVNLPDHIGKSVFQIKIRLAEPPRDPGLWLYTEYLADVNHSCSGVLRSNLCFIQAAVVDTPVTLEWSEVTLKSKPIMRSSYNSTGDLYQVPTGTPAGPLSGIQRTIGHLFDAESTLEKMNIVNSDNIATIFWDPLSNPRDCGHDYIDPTEYVLDVMGNFMYYASFATARASGGAFDRSVTAEKTTPITTYQTDLRYLSGALVVMLGGLVSVVTLLWGWWRLDRWNITLSPLETGKAFGAPLLISDRDSDEADDILKDKGRIMVRYDGMAIAPDLNGGRPDAELQLLRTRSP